MTLFPDVDVSRPGTDGRPAGAKPSADRARTERRSVMIARGQHPTGLGKINPEHKCGECRMRFAHSNGRSTWWKCMMIPPTSGPGTDIRLKWPSCPFFEAGEAMTYAEAKEFDTHRPPIRRIVEERANQ